MGTSTKTAKEKVAESTTEAPEETPAETPQATEPSLTEVVDGLANLGTAVQAIGEVVKTIGKNQSEQAEQITQLFELATEKEPAPDVPDPEDVHETPHELPDELMTGLPVGTVRFSSTIARYNIWLEPESHLIGEGGRLVRHPGRRVQFENYIADVTDEVTIQALRDDPLFKVDFWEDPTAKPRSTVEVREGARSVGTTTSRAPAAPMAVRA